MKKNKFFLPVSLSFMMCLTCSAVPAAYAAEADGVLSIEEYSNDTLSDSKESDFQPVYDFHNMYGTKDENYSVYLKHGKGPQFEIIKKTYMGKAVRLTLTEGTDKQKIIETVEKYTDAEKSGVEVTVSEENPLLVNVEQEKPYGNCLSQENAVNIIRELHESGSISDAEFITSRFLVKTGSITADKYPAEKRAVIEECIKDGLEEYVSIEETGEYGDEYIRVVPKSEENEYLYKAAGRIFSKSGVTHEIIWNDDCRETAEKTDMDTLLSLSKYPEYTADSEESMEVLKNILSAYPDFSDGGLIYVNPEYKVDFVKNESDYVMIIHGLSEKNVPESRDEVFLSKLSVPVFSLWDKIDRRFYTGEVGGGYMDEGYCSIRLCMEGELPVKEVLRGPDKYEEVLMTEEETPECMLKYIYPDRYRNNSLVLNGALFPDMSLSLGDLNGDHQTDLTDLSILSLRLLGETELSKNQIKSADVDEDDMITVTDLSRIKQFVSHIISSL